MTEALKIQPHHLERGAYLYVRQSSMRQVIENVESTKRQYALRRRATALGWRDDQITVIDSDQRRHDRLPITKTIRIRSSSLVNGMYLKGDGSLSSGASQDGVFLSFL